MFIEATLESKGNFLDMPLISTKFYISELTIFISLKGTFLPFIS